MDYCFVKDSNDTDMATVLAGRLYPKSSVFCTVVDSKGAEDEKAVNRLTQFIREAGIPRLIYKSNEENAICKMIGRLHRPRRTSVTIDPFRLLASRVNER